MHKITSAFASTADAQHRHWNASLPTADAMHKVTSAFASTADAQHRHWNTSLPTAQRCSSARPTRVQKSSTARISNAVSADLQRPLADTANKLSPTAHLSTHSLSAEAIAQETTLSSGFHLHCADQVQTHHTTPHHCTGRKNRSSLKGAQLAAQRIRN
jgi:hypothetical protein